MGNFRHILNGKTSRLQHKYSKKIVLMFNTIAQSYRYEKIGARKLNTNCIKYSLVKLGHELGYRVYANGLSTEQKNEQFEKYKFVCREFLYDVHWYTDKAGEYYIPENVSLVVESELGHSRKGDSSRQKNAAVKFDFQKLLMANADLKLMIFKAENMNDLNDLDSYFENAIKSYSLLSIGSVFLFVCFMHDIQEIYYDEKYK